MSKDFNNFFNDDDDYIDIFGESDDTIKKLSGDNISSEEPEEQYEQRQSNKGNIYSNSKHNNSQNDYNDSYYEEDSEYNEDGVDNDEYYDDYTPLWFKVIMISLYAIILIFAFIGILAVCSPNVRGALFG